MILDGEPQISRAGIFAAGVAPHLVPPRLPVPAPCRAQPAPRKGDDLNPIEEAFPKIKGTVLKAEVGIREALVEAMGAAISRSVPATPVAFLSTVGTPRRLIAT
jgi:hypothetical protein